MEVKKFCHLQPFWISASVNNKLPNYPPCSSASAVFAVKIQPRSGDM